MVPKMVPDFSFVSFEVVAKMVPDFSFVSFEVVGSVARHTGKMVPDLSY
jgi:hypothetical protein